MSFDERYVVDRLRSTEQLAVQGQYPEGFESLLTDISAEQLREGVHISFGGDRIATQHFIDALDIEGLLANGILHISNILVYTQGIQSWLGSARDTIAKHPLLDGLDILQASNCKVDQDFTGLNMIRPSRTPVSADIILTHQIEKDGVAVIDVNSPGVTVSLTQQFLPEIWGDDDAYDYKTLADILYEARTYDQTEVVTRINDVFMIDGATLEMPDKNYGVTIGMIDQYHHSKFQGAISARLEYGFTANGLYSLK